MIITTTPDVAGREVAQYLGVAVGEAILGANIFKDVFASVRDIVGGRSASYEKVLREARDQAFADLEAEARQRGGDAVIGVDLDYEVISSGSGTSMLLVSISGTAVRLAPAR